MGKIRAVADSTLSGFAGGGLRMGGNGDIIGKIPGSGGNGGQLPGGVGNITGKTPGFRKFIVHF